MRSGVFAKVLNNALLEIVPSKTELISVESKIKDFREKISNRIKKLHIDADVFVGGSFAKRTIIKKRVYDVDVFIRFDKGYKDISELTKKILGDFSVEEVKGSRNYFVINMKDFLLEIVPVMKVKNPKNAANVTDLSYAHVNYIKRKLKGGKILNEIKLAKAFCYANNCYGAESYIKGFSGYSLELLVYHYGSFLNFLKAFSNIKLGEKQVIDIEKHFKNKKDVFIDLNESKLKSPVILVDPTYKSRNALAALADETFAKFQIVCRKFLKTPSINFFRQKTIDIEKIRKESFKKKLDFATLEIRTDRQSGDIAGSKLLKFYNHLGNEISKYFTIKNRGFSYDSGKIASGFFSAKKKLEIISKGPRTDQKESVDAFKKAHKKIFIKSGRIYATKKMNFNLKKFIDDWKKKNKKQMEEMGMTSIKIL